MESMEVGDSPPSPILEIVALKALPHYYSHPQYQLVLSFNLLTSSLSYTDLLMYFIFLVRYTPSFCYLFLYIFQSRHMLLFQYIESCTSFFSNFGAISPYFQRLSTNISTTFGDISQPKPLQSNLLVKRNRNYSSPQFRLRLSKQQLVE